MAHVTITPRDEVQVVGVQSPLPRPNFPLPSSREWQEDAAARPRGSAPRLTRARVLNLAVARASDGQRPIGRSWWLGGFETTVT